MAIPREALDRAATQGQLVMRSEVAAELPGGLAIYGRRFGRYPLDPTVIFLRPRWLRHAGLAQIAGGDRGELRECDLRLLDFGVQALFPFEVVVAAVTAARERLDLPPHRHLARTGEHVAAASRSRGGRHRVFEVHVPDVAPQLADRVFGLLLAGDERVMRVPQQGGSGGGRLLEQREQRGGVGEIAV